LQAYSPWIPVWAGKSVLQIVVTELVECAFLAQDPSFVRVVQEVHELSWQLSMQY
jgi:hypothetical protein